MIVGIAALLLAQAATPSAMNGVWVSPQGDAFTVAEPYTIWATLDHRHFSGYQFSSAGTGYSGLFQSSRELKPGYSEDPQVKAQYDLLSDTSAKFPTDHLDVPLELPCVTPPDKSKTVSYGTVTLDKVQSDTMHMNWTNAQGQNDFSGVVTKAGGDEVIDFTGSYVYSNVVISLADVGKGPKHTLVGTVKISGVTYKLKGLRVWTRGTITLTPQTSNDVVGTGWIEWAPSAKFALGIKASKPQPTDQIRSFVGLSINGSNTGATYLLTRVPGQ